MSVVEQAVEHGADRGRVAYDLGMRKLPLTAAEELLEIIMRRYERASTMLTSNRPVGDWGKLFVVSSLRSRHWPCPRRLQTLAGVNVPDAILVGRFSGDNHWPVLGDR